MAYRTRIKYTAAQRAEIWDRWQRGESLNSIGRAFDRPSSSIFGQLAPSGGIRPPPNRKPIGSNTLNYYNIINKLHNFIIFKNTLTL